MIMYQYKDSRKIFKQYDGLIKRKRCYDNIWNIYDKTNLFRINPEWQVAFGYVSFDAKLCIGHCFIVENNQVIDPTLPDCRDAYYIVELFSTKDYLEAIFETGVTDLKTYEPLEKRYAVVTEKLNDMGLQCIR